MKIVEKRPAMERFDYIVNHWKEQLMQCQTDTNELVFRLRDFVQTELDINRIKSNRWIPCSDRLPSDFSYVLCSGRDGMGILRYIGEKWLDENALAYSVNEITHWMPLPEIPEPPEKEAENE